MKHLAGIAVVILVGGLGTRLRSVVHDRPKILAQVMGSPFLTYLLDQISTAGASKVILCTGYLGGMLHEVYGDVYKSLHLLYSQENEPLGTGGALRLALPLIESDHVLVMNGDSYVWTDLNRYMDWFFQIDRKVSLLLVKVTDTSRYGMVKVEENNSVAVFEEKEKAKGAGWINAGVYCMKTSLLKLIPEGKVSSLEKNFFPSLVGNGFFGYQCKGKFIDIGTPESYASAEIFFGKNKMKIVKDNAYGGDENP
jgi:D-glycero-alpha-D-manno-heptose 1-phosphate guanylyltransferase